MLAALGIFKLVFSPLLGMFGAWMTVKADERKEIRAAEDRIADRAHDLAVINAEGDLALKKVTLDASSRQAVSENTAFADSYTFANDNLIPEGAKLTNEQMNRVVWIEVINKAVRPFGVMWYQLLLAVIFGWAAVKLIGSTGKAFSDAEMAAMFRDVAYSIIGMAETSFFWYFGIRRMSKRAQPT
jgi:hypothetical protein